MTTKTNGLLVILNGPRHGGIPRNHADSSQVSAFWQEDIANEIGVITGKTPCIATPKNIWRAANTWCNSSGSLPSGLTPRVVRTDEFIGEMYLDQMVRENTNKGLSKSVAGRIVYCTHEQYLNQGIDCIQPVFGQWDIPGCPQKSKIIGVFANAGFECVTSDLVVTLGEQIEQISKAYDPVSVRSSVEAFVSNNLGTKLGSGGLYYMPTGYEEKARELRRLFKHDAGPQWSFGFENIGSDAVEHWGEQILESLEKGFEDISKLKAEKGKRKDNAISKLKSWKEQLLNAKHLLDTLPGAVDKLQDQFRNKLSELQSDVDTTVAIPAPVLLEPINIVADVDEGNVDQDKSPQDDHEPAPKLSIVKDEKPEEKPKAFNWNDSESDELLDF